MGAGGRRVHQQGSAAVAPHANAAPHSAHVDAVAEVVVEVADRGKSVGIHHPPSGRASRAALENRSLKPVRGTLSWE
jgi:hypothetical protein